MKKLSYLFGLAALLLPYLAGATTHDPALLRVRHEQPLTQRMVTTSVSETEIGETAVLQFFPDVAFTTTVFKISHETDSALIRYNDDARGASGLSVTTSDGTRLTIRDNQKQRLYQKVSLADGRFEYREYDLTAAPISTPLPPRPAPPSNELLSLPSSTPLSLNDQPIALAGEETTIIDVMVVYDTTAQAWVAGNGGMQAFAADTIERMNLALEASGIDARFRLVTAIGKNYTYTSSSGLDGALDAICDNVGVFMDIESLRTTYGADVVSLLVDTGSAYGFTGLSFEMMDKRGHPRYAYNTCSIQAVNQGHTLTHETGHILGCGHALNQKGSPGPGIYPYSCGYYFTVGLQKYHTIMGYSNDGYGNTYAASDYFSTPLKTYGASGVPVGTVNNDNARTFRENMGVISAYRAAKPAYTVTLDANGGSGGSVSVEAFVGQSMPVASAPVLSGYRFLGYWDTPMGSGGIQYYDSQMSSVRIWNKNSNATLYAWWVDANIEHYNISATVNPPASGVIYGTGLKEPAETCVALAAANTGYIFSNWTENGEIVSTTAGYTFTVLGDRELTANFTPVKVLSVNPTVRTVGKTAGTTTFEVSNTGNGTFSWSAAVTSGGTWAKITSGKNGTNTGTITLSIAANTLGGEERIAIVKVTANGAANNPMELTITQAANPVINTTVTFDPQGGVVTPVSKTVSSGLAYGALPIPTRDDHTFAGWWTAAVGGTPVTATTIVTAETPHTIYAHWTESINAMVGFATAIDLPAEFAGAAGIKVAKQPTGLKLNTSTKRLEGIPTKAGLFNTTVSATGIPAQNLVIVVEALPAWAIGTFDGYVKIEPADTMVATATMTVSATAKISGKFKLGAKSYSFTAPSFKEKVSDDVYSAETIIKIGKDTINMDLQITRAASLDPTAFATLGTAEGGFEQEGEEYSLTLSRNIWKDAGAAALLAPFIGYYTAAVLPDAGDTYGSGYLTFTINNKGSVKTSGKLADGTSVSLSSILMGVDTNLTYTLLYVTPSGYKGGWFSGMILFEIIDAEPVILTSLADAWCSLNPQATGEYGEGFLRDADIAGGWYDKLINLRAYFEDGIEVGGIVLPELLAAVKTTDWNPDNPSKKITTTANELINAMEDASPVGLILGLTPATGIATGFVAPANDAPTKLPDGSYDYTVDKNGDGQSNTSGLTFKFTRATGLFSGKFSIWYDYVSAQDLTTDKETLKHESKSASFQGVITPTATDGTAGRGYYLWADQSEYDTGKTDKNGNPVMKSYKYNNSFDFLLLVP